MFRRQQLLSVVCVFAFVAAACGGSSDSEAADATSDVDAAGSTADQQEGSTGAPDVTAAGEPSDGQASTTSAPRVGPSADSDFCVWAAEADARIDAVEFDETGIAVLRDVYTEGTSRAPGALSDDFASLASFIDEAERIYIEFDYDFTNEELGRRLDELTETVDEAAATRIEDHLRDECGINLS